MAALVLATGMLAVPAGPAAAANASVRIEDFQFRPGTVRIAVGERVTWRNEDGDEHRVATEDDAPEHFDSGSLEEGEEFSRTFDEGGVYRYRCEIHDSMKGVVEVAEAPPPTTTTTAPPPPTTTAPPTTSTTVRPTTTTTAPAPTTTTPPPPATTAPPPTRNPSADPSTTTTKPAPPPSTTSTTGPPESTTTSSSTSTSSTTTTVTPAPAPEGPPLDPTVAGVVLGPPGPEDTPERDRSVVGAASGAISSEAGPGPWVVLGLLLFAATAAFGAWNLWAYRPSRT